MPRQLCMPYQNEPDYQKLLQRHIEKGSVMRSFDFPAMQGKLYRDKTDQTENALLRHSVTTPNKNYGSRISMKLSKPDQVTGFKDVYLSGTHLAEKISKSTKAMDAKRFNPGKLLTASNKVVSFAENLTVDSIDEYGIGKPPRTAANSSVKVGNLMMGRDQLQTPQSAMNTRKKPNLTTTQTKLPSHDKNGLLGNRPEDIRKPQN